MAPPHARRVEILRQSEGVPRAAASPDAIVLVCDLIRSTKADWRWADEHPDLRKPWSTKEDRARVAWMRLYCGKPLIFACLKTDRSVFSVLVDPTVRKAVFWDESRWLPSGRTIRHCSGPPGSAGSRDWPHVMSPELAVQRSIARAERILPGRPAPDGRRDRRWQAIIRVGEFIETQPEPVWQFAHRWGKHAQADLRTAVATCLLEHLLEHHFELVFPRVRRAALESVRFADTFSLCWCFRPSKEPKNAARIKRLQSQLRRRRAAKRRAT